jgi:hypothetical protein
VASPEETVRAAADTAMLDASRVRAEAPRMDQLLQAVGRKDDSLVQDGFRPVVFCVESLECNELDETEHVFANAGKGEN